MSRKFIGREFTDKAQNYIKTKVNEAKNTIDNNINSMFGTIWTQSTSAVAGITESVITPGIRFIKFVVGVMQVYKKLQHNLTTIKNKVTRITDIINGFSTGKHNHIRKSVIKYKVNVK